MNMHFYIRDVDADAGKCPTQPGIIGFWMKKFGGDTDLLAFRRLLQGAWYQLKTNNFREVLEVNWLRFNRIVTADPV